MIKEALFLDAVVAIVVAVAVVIVVVVVNVMAVAVTVFCHIRRKDIEKERRVADKWLIIKTEEWRFPGIRIHFKDFFLHSS